MHESMAFHLLLSIGKVINVTVTKLIKFYETRSVLYETLLSHPRQRHLMKAILLALIIIGLFSFGFGFAASQAHAFKIAAVGDISCGSSATTNINNIKAAKVDLALWLGDLSYTSTPDCFISMTSGITSLAVIGNHDDPEDGSAAYRQAVVKFYNLGPGYWSQKYDGGKILVIGMDSGQNFASGSAQYNFVKNALTTNKDVPVKIIAIHKPFLSCTCKHAQNGQFNIYHSLFKQFGVNLVLQGHDHNAQFYKPVDNVNYFVMGSGGKSHYALATTPKATFFKDATKYGYLSLDINTDTQTAKGAMIQSDRSPVAGSSFNIALNQSAPPPPPPPPPTPTPSDNSSKLNVTSVNASTFQDPNIPANTLDNNILTRWSGEGDGATISYKFDKIYNVTKVGIAFFKGDQRIASFEINGKKFTSSGKTIDFQNFTLTPKEASEITIIGHINTANTFNSYTEVRFYGNGGKPIPPPVQEEVCGDGIDNNQNGQVDENCINVVHACNNQTTSNNCLAQNITVSIVNESNTSFIPYNDTITIKPLTNNSEIFVLADQNSTVTVKPSH